MRNFTNFMSWVVLAVLAAPLSAMTASLPARIFFSDLVSGPNTGGQDNKGAFVTIYGKGFGAARDGSSVTVGGGTADNYPIWTDTRVTFQLGPGARTGNIEVHLSHGGASNGVPFVVRPGRIFFVATHGSDGSRGSFTSPWKTLVKAKNSMRRGDITYVMDGVSQTPEDNYSGALCVFEGGTAAEPIALVAYPGARATIGTPTGPPSGVRVPNLQITPSYWVLAGLELRGKYLAVDLGGGPGYGTKGWRIVGNDISCPNGDGSDACVETSRASDVKFYGNYVHDVGVNTRPTPSKKYHAVYFSTDSNHIEVAWNIIVNNQACRALQFHSSPTSSKKYDGYNQYDLIVHDNLIHDSRCDGINFATVDPSKGPVVAYNNVIYNAGIGPDPEDGYADYACIYVPGTVNNGEPGKGTVELFNNTLYNCGSRGESGSGIIAGGNTERSPALLINIRNNIVVSVGHEHYVSRDSDTSLFRGSHNLFYGAGSGPSFLSNNVNADPRFVNPSGFDFRLQGGSPAIGAGVDTGIASDFDGIARPRGAAFNLGAFQFVSQVSRRQSDTKKEFGSQESSTPGIAVAPSQATRDGLWRNLR